MKMGQWLYKETFNTLKKKKSGVKFTSARAGGQCCPWGHGYGPTCQEQATGCGATLERNGTEPRLEASLTGALQVCVTQSLGYSRLAG